MEQETVRATGGCLCGAVRYEAELIPHGAYYCHCRTCQKSSGAPAEADVQIKPDSLRFTQGQPKYFRSSHFAERGFCPECGSRLTYRMLSGDWTNITIGCLDHPENVRPETHYCVEAQLPWYKPDDHLPKVRSDEVPELVAAWAAGEKT